MDSTVLPCDSYLGVCFYVVSAVAFVFLLLGYAYMLRSMSGLVTAEFKGSKFVDVLEKLMRIREEEVREYNVRRDTDVLLRRSIMCVDFTLQDRFSFVTRCLIATQLEIGIQARHVRSGIIFFFTTTLKVIRGVLGVSHLLHSDVLSLLQ